MANILEFDELKMYFGDDYIVNDYITIHTPTVGEIVEFGEKEYFSTVYTLTAIPSDMKSQLFDMGIDYETLDDFHLFYMLTRGLEQSASSILLGDLDLTKFNMYINEETEEEVMVNPETNAILDKLAYLKIVNYIRKLHNIKPKIEHAANKTTKRILIQLDRDKIARSKNEPYKSQLRPLISAMMRYPGFKYKSNELKECSIYEFMDTIYGAQIYISSTALLQGSYSGMIDTSKINKKEFNWMRLPDEK